MAKKTKKSVMPKYEIRKCATLGTLFRDIYCDGKLFAMQLPAPVAKWLLANPEHFLGNIGAPVEMLRTWAIENEYQMFTGLDPRG